MVDATLKFKVDTILENLPLDGQEELTEFLEFLADKYGVERGKNIIVLGGIWKDTPLNIMDEKVRKLRKALSNQLVNKLGNGG